MSYNKLNLTTTLLLLYVKVAPFSIKGIAKSTFSIKNGTMLIKNSKGLDLGAEPLCLKKILQ